MCLSRILCFSKSNVKDFWLVYPESSTSKQNTQIFWSNLLLFCLYVTLYSFIFCFHSCWWHRRIVLLSSPPPIPSAPHQNHTHWGISVSLLLISTIAVVYPKSNLLLIHYLTLEIPPPLPNPVTFYLLDIKPFTSLYVTSIFIYICGTGWTSI